MTVSEKMLLIIPIDNEKFVANVEVAISKQFLAWVIGLGEGVVITSPKSVVDMMKREIERLVKQYKM